VLSEFKLDFEPTKRSFPQRNRLIAGISDVLFLPEAREGSGSLITANFALQMKKEIFVAPNQLFSPNGFGSNQLISTKQVQLLTNFQQILEKFKKKQTETVKASTPSIKLTPEEEKMIQIVHRYAHQEVSQRSTNCPLDF
jgi:DNA processing protein